MARRLVFWRFGPGWEECCGFSDRYPRGVRNTSCERSPVLPKEILEEVDQIAGKRGRSLFIAEAALEKLERERFLKILEETRGAWADKRHPDLRSPRDMEAYLGKHRDSLPS